MHKYVIFHNYFLLLIWNFASSLEKQHVISTEVVEGAKRCALPAVRRALAQRGGRGAKRGPDHAAVPHCVRDAPPVAPPVAPLVAPPVALPAEPQCGQSAMSMMLHLQNRQASGVSLGARFSCADLTILHSGFGYLLRLLRSLANTQRLRPKIAHVIEIEMTRNLATAHHPDRHIGIWRW
jgi:hypothetical protein